ncbi:MAG: FkbM family methyltransferase [Candidatus Nitrohelix vancouverensis]|uniref:FkbM family methyltransferase n=1 Tax=Candidatus Nitrohelix vancouverensis TaxID=2705534 RepID=A0A7T0C3N0_9BACT|nr:MAG: FkbM family methyltransferase [Candidatus Nitrohelix vancouverensis]
MCHHSPANFAAALFQKPFYVAFINIFRFFDNPLGILRRYVLGKGKYPAVCSVRTPVGRQEITLYDFADMITAVECFGKLDYKAPADISCVVDFGSNIGISALYFLTRNRNVRVYLYEPLPQNIERLKKNLQGYEDRYELHPVAVGLEAARATFGFESTGRYGGLNKENLPNSFDVEVRDSSEILDGVLLKHPRVNILKIDVEGLEDALLERLTPEQLSRIDSICAETDAGPAIDGFRQTRYGAIARYSK